MQFPLVALLLHTQTVQVGEIQLIVIDRRSPTIPGIVVLVERIHVLLGAEMAFAGVLGNVAGGFQVLLEDDIAGTQNRFMPVMCTLAIGRDVAVASGGQCSARGSA